MACSDEGEHCSGEARRGPGRGGGEGYTTTGETCGEFFHSIGLVDLFFKEITVLRG